MKVICSVVLGVPSCRICYHIIPSPGVLTSPFKVCITKNWRIIPRVEIGESRIDVESRGERVICLRKRSGQWRRQWFIVNGLATKTTTCSQGLWHHQSDTSILDNDVDNESFSTDNYKQWMKRSVANNTDTTYILDTLEMYFRVHECVRRTLPNQAAKFNQLVNNCLVRLWNMRASQRASYSHTAWPCPPTIWFSNHDTDISVLNEVNQNGPNCMLAEAK